MSENKFEGWAAVDTKAVEGNLKWISYTPKTFCADDVEGESPPICLWHVGSKLIVQSRSCTLVFAVPTFIPSQADGGTCRRNGPWSSGMRLLAKSSVLETRSRGSRWGIWLVLARNATRVWTASHATIVSPIELVEAYRLIRTREGELLYT